MIEMQWQPWTAVGRKEQVASAPEFITTYRSGTKWLNPELIGQRVALVGTVDGVKFAEATIVSVKATQFKNIDAQDHSRQTADMTPDNRLLVMQSCYGQTFTDDSLTTVVTLGEVAAV